MVFAGPSVSWTLTSPSKMGHLTPLIPLYPDLWTRITELLPLESVLKLLKLGNAQLTSMLLANVQRLHWHYPNRVVDFEAFLRMSQSFTALKEIDIRKEMYTALVKSPLEPLALPRNLTSLSVSLSEVYTLLVPLKLSTMVPGLVSLSLEGAYSSFQFKFEDLDLPAHLETLSLCVPYPKPTLNPDFISKLPRSLLGLTLHYSVARKDLSELDNATYDWPPSLTQCNLECDAVTVERLPRTVTDLRLRVVGRAPETTFPQNNHKGFVASSASFIFPWRRFFPRLTSLVLSIHAQQPFIPVLSTIVLDTELDSAMVSDFIASGFWDVPSLQHMRGGSKEAYPTYTLLSTPQHDETQFINELAKVAPFISNTVFDDVIGSMELLSRIPTALDVATEGPFPRHLTLPKSVQSLVVEGDVPISALPPNLKKLVCQTLVGSEEDGSVAPHDAFPEGLQDLGAAYCLLRIDLVSILPKSLTFIALRIDSPPSWNLLAERLSSLKTLRVALAGQWACDQPLSPVSSKILKEFALDVTMDQRMGEEQRYGEFLRALPPNLASLHLSGWWHVSVMALLPRALTGLFIESAFHWTPEMEPYPEAVGMSPEDLLRCLSPCLGELRLTGMAANRPGVTKVTYPCLQMVQHLPRSLYSLRTLGVFEINGGDDGPTTESIVALLPPKMVSCSLEFTRFKLEDLHPSGFLL